MPVGTAGSHVAQADTGRHRVPHQLSRCLLTLCVGVLKIVFGSRWKLAFVAGNCLLVVAVAALSTRLLFKA